MIVASCGIDVMWSMTVYDVERTVRASCAKLFIDKSVEKHCWKVRASGLLRLGKIMK